MAGARNSWTAIVALGLALVAGLSVSRKREQYQGIRPLAELRDRGRLWPPDLSKPLSTLKLFVYDIPDELQLSEQQVNRCRWSSYNSELILHDVIQSRAAALSPHLTVVTDQDQADAFWVPLFSSCYLFNCWVDAGWNQTERCGVDEAYIQPILGYVHHQASWRRSSGADHIIPHPMDHVDGYYSELSRSLMNQSVYLVTNGDRRPPPYSSFYRRHRDVVVPSATHLLHGYYVNPRDYLDHEGRPYTKPLTRDDYELLNTRRRSELFEPTGRGLKAMWPQSHLRRRSRRTNTVVFRGSQGRPEDGEKYSLGIRELFFKKSKRGWFRTSTVDGFDSIRGFDISQSSENRDYALALSKAKFGLVPPGYTLDTTRLWEYLAFGVVPVFVGTGHHAGQVMPFEDDFDYDTFSVFVPRDQAHRLPQVLAKISMSEYEQLQRQAWRVGRLLVLEHRQGNVWNWIARDLCRILRIGPGQGGSLP